MNTKPLKAAAAFGVGMGYVYFFSPHVSLRRRKIVRDQMFHLGLKIGRGSAATFRDLAHRTQGILAVSRRRFQGSEVPDEILKERIRAKLGRAVSHPHAIEVNVKDGTASLKGPIFAEQVDNLISSVKKISGLKGLENSLSVYEEGSHIPSLQGGKKPPDLLKRGNSSWSPAKRLLLSLGISLAGIIGVLQREHHAALTLT